MKKYILFGNAESVHIVKWVRELNKYFDVFVISSTNVHPEISALIPRHRIFKLDMQIGAKGGNYQIIKKYYAVKSIISSIGPDFINPHYITSHGFLLAIISKFNLHRYKLIQSTWGTDILVTPFKNKIYYHLTKFALNQADLITSDSDYMTEIIRKLSKSETITFTFGLDEIPDISNSQKEENLFYSNRMLIENYNIREVILLFSRISKVNSLARLVISHDGELRNELEGLSKELGLQDKIAFKGFISPEEQISWYNKSQFYISIPTSDSTSVSLLEAMAYGCIPILSDIPANHEWIKDGVNGIIYRKTDFDISRISDILEQKDVIAERNRKIITQKGIFPDSIRNFVEKINQL